MITYIFERSQLYSLLLTLSRSDEVVPHGVEVDEVAQDGHDVPRGVEVGPVVPHVEHEAHSEQEGTAAEQLPRGVDGSRLHESKKQGSHRGEAQVREK